MPSDGRDSHGFRKVVGCTKDNINIVLDMAISFEHIYKGFLTVQCIDDLTSWIPPFHATLIGGLRQEL